METKLAGKARVIRLDVFSRVGRQAAARYGVRGTPTVIVLDGRGDLVYGQAGLPQSAQLVEQVEAVLISK
ncbi:MAG: hypothetical protein L6R45_26735 [Anaerolineae bacterium]|nr:hypothetical protein [Anaerolineae bacterium]